MQFSYLLYVTKDGKPSEDGINYLLDHNMIDDIISEMHACSSNKVSRSFYEVQLLGTETSAEFIEFLGSIGVNCFIHVMSVGVETSLTAAQLAYSYDDFIVWKDSDGNVIEGFGDNLEDEPEKALRTVDYMKIEMGVLVAYLDDEDDDDEDDNELDFDDDEQEVIVC